MKPDEQESDYQMRMKERLEGGHAWMICNECGGKLYDFDGNEDKDTRCPYRKNGKCEPC